MVTSGERPIRMFVVHARLGGGFHVVFAPADLTPEQLEAALTELGIDGDELLELGGWRTSGDGVAVAWVPLPEGE
jgi:hypothetical protein